MLHLSNTFCRYDIMRRCWLNSPTDRPKFTQLVQEIDAMLEDRFDYLDVEAEGAVNSAGETLDRVMGKILWSHKSQQ